MGDISDSRYLIINADDFGLSDGVTEGIVKAWCDGVVTSASAMINIEGAPERVAAAHTAHPDLPIGLHLTITSGSPVLEPDQVPTLVDAEGRFHSRATIFAHLRNIELSELRAELSAQAQLLIDSGVTFDHLDYHQHILAKYTPFYPLVRSLAREYGVPVRQPVPASLHGVVETQGGAVGATLREMMRFAQRHPILALRLMRYMSSNSFREQAALLEAESIGTTDWFVGNYYTNPTVEGFIEVLHQLPPGVGEVMAHPAVVDDQLEELGGDYVAQRADELAVMLDPAVAQAIDDLDIHLVDFYFVRTRFH